MGLNTRATKCPRLRYEIIHSLPQSRSAGKNVWEDRWGQRWSEYRFPDQIIFVSSLSLSKLLAHDIHSPPQIRTCPRLPLGDSRCGDRPRYSNSATTRNFAQIVILTVVRNHPGPQLRRASSRLFSSPEDCTSPARSERGRHAQTSNPSGFDLGIWRDVLSSFSRCDNAMENAKREEYSSALVRRSCILM